MKKEKTFKTLNGETQEYDVWKMSDAKDIKKKSETCEGKLRRMCKDIAETISTPLEDVHEWMNDVYDIEWVTHNDHSYKGARLLVAGGGPSIWVNLQGLTVDGYWWGDHCKVPFADNIGLDDYLEELHASSK